MNTDKKRTEERYAAALLQYLHIPPSRLEYCEAPDFLVREENRTIGIEITELTRIRAGASGQLDHVRESEQSIVVGLARDRYIALSGSPVVVSIHFTNCRLDKRVRAEVSDWLAELVFRNQPGIGEQFEWEANDQLCENHPLCLASVSAIRLQNGREHSWLTSPSAWVNEGVDEAVETAIKSKESKRPNYARKCDECWLLLVASWKRGTTFFEWSSELQDIQNHGGFRRVFFFDASVGKVTEMKCD